VLEKLKDDFAFEYQARVDDAHSAVRICTCWATKEENVEALLAALRGLLR
jgi:threonine aldolase